MEYKIGVIFLTLIQLLLLDFAIKSLSLLNHFNSNVRVINILLWFFLQLVQIGISEVQR